MDAATMKKWTAAQSVTAPYPPIIFLVICALGIRMMNSQKICGRNVATEKAVAMSPLAKRGSAATATDDDEAICAATGDDDTTCCTAPNAEDGSIIIDNGGEVIPRGCDGDAPAVGFRWGTVARPTKADGAAHTAGEAKRRSAAIDSIRYGAAAMAIACIFSVDLAGEMFPVDNVVVTVVSRSF